MVSVGANEFIYHKSGIDINQNSEILFQKGLATLAWQHIMVSNDKKEICHKILWKLYKCHFK